MSYFVEESINSLTDLVPILLRHCPPENIRWFRGQRNSSWELKPRLSRNTSTTHDEEIIIARFRQNAYQYVSNNFESEWNILYLMQHYGAPTRLLDWSENPLAALYFATEEQFNEAATDGMLWILDPVALNKLANIEDENPKYLPLDTEVAMHNYKPSILRAERKTKLNPIAFIAPRNSSRMVAQLGTFTVCHREMINLADLGNQNHVGKIIIPANRKVEIRKELSALRINHLTLFPELASVASYAGGSI